MRLDQSHVSKLRAAIAQNPDGNRHVDLDIPHLTSSLRRLNLWEGGLLIDTLMRAAQAKRLSKEQRVLLALFVHNQDREAQDGDRN